jgi:hypothetical protein
MKSIWILLIFISIESASWASCISGRDSLNEITVAYRMRNNYYIIPVMINDTISVNLLLDPHCKAVILFGKRYKKLLEVKRKNHIKIAGKHGGAALQSLHNKISVGPAMGENLPIVILSNKNPFNFFTSVNGVMGYDLLADCEIIVDKKTETMIIRRRVQKNMTAQASRSK